MKTKVFKVDGEILGVGYDGSEITVKYSEFKNGDIVSKGYVVLIYRGTDEHGAILFNASWSEHKGDIEIENRIGRGWGYTTGFSLATKEEQERFIKKLAEHGKQINPETKELEDIVSLPSDIKIFKRPLTGKLGIGFNDNKQILFYGSNLWCVMGSEYCSLAKVKLTPCKRSDLKAGDLAVGLRTAYEIIDTDICLVLGDRKEAWAIEDGVYFGIWDLCNIWYKIEEA